MLGCREIFQGLFCTCFMPFFISGVFWLLCSVKGGTILFGHSEPENSAGTSPYNFNFVLVSAKDFPFSGRSRSTGK